MSASASLLELLASCGLENRAKLFEDEGYTLEIAMKAVRDDQTTLLNDLRELKLPMDECRKLMEALAAADNAGIPHAGETGARAHEQMATTGARATEEAKVMAAGAAIPTAAVTIEMEPAPAKETNSPSPKASNQDTLIYDIGHIISWVVALGIGFYMASKTQGGAAGAGFSLRPSANCLRFSWSGTAFLTKMETAAVGVLVTALRSPVRCTTSCLYSWHSPRSGCPLSSGVSPSPLEDCQPRTCPGLVGCTFSSPPTPPPSH